MSDEEWEWLSSTRWLQSTYFGVNYEQLKDEKLADYLMEQAFAAASELVEAMNEVRWKTWAVKRGEMDPVAFKCEIVDMLHFVGNMLVAAGITEEELWTEYQAKQQRNVARVTAGYDSKASKCPRCQRELDKPGAVITRPEEEADEGIPLACFSCLELLGWLRWNDTIDWRNGVNVPQVTAATLYA